MTENAASDYLWRRANCPWCRQTAHIKLIHYGRREYNFSSWENTHIGNHGGMYFLGECQTCGNPLMFKQALCSGPDEFPDAGIEWPAWDCLARGTSEVVQAIFSQAYIIQKRSPVAYVGQIRRAVEALLNEMGIPPAALQKRIAEAARDQRFPPTVVEALDLLRRLGNAATHHPATDISYLYTHVVSNLFRHVVDYFYGLPNSVREAREALSRIEKEHKPAGQ